MSVIFNDWARKEQEKCLARFTDKKGRVRTCQKKFNHRGEHKS